MKLESSPRTIILTSLFSIVAGGILIYIGGWFGYAPLTYGFIMLLVGLVAASNPDSDTET